MLKNNIINISLVLALFYSVVHADCIKPIYPGENLWKLVARIGDCIDDTLEQTSSKLDTLACDNTGCEVTISQADIPYVITQPGIYCLAESVVGTALDDALITVSASNVVLDLKEHHMDGGGQSGFAQGAQDGIVVYPGLKNIVIKNGTLAHFAAHGINASSALEPNIQTPLERLTIADIQVMDLSSYLPGLSNMDQPDLIGSVLDSISGESGFDPVLECCLGNQFDRVKQAVGIYVDCANQVTVTNCNSCGVQGDGIYLRYVQAAVVKNCDSSNNGGNGFVFDNCDVSSVACCKAEQNGCNGFYEVSCNGDNGYSNCTAKQNGVHGFRIIGSGKIIDSCIANQNTLDGFFVVSPENSTVDGSLDITFGGDGKVLSDFGGIDIARAAVIQKDGKIVVAGDSNGADLLLARYNGDGSLDMSFGVNGLVVTSLVENGNAANGLALQEDGKIVIAGQANVSPGFYDFILQRYDVNGSLEMSVVTDLGSSGDFARSVAIQEDGKIIAAGTSNSDFALVRYNIDGSLDMSFGGTGIVLTDFSSSSIDQINGIALQKDGKIVAAGTTNASGSNDFALARYNTDGSLDTSFGIAGKVITDFAGSVDQAFDVAIQKDGKIVVVGSAFVGDSNNFALARYNSDGSLDTDFGAMGKVTTEFGGGTNDQAASVAIQKDGKIIAVGFTSFGGPFNFALARYHTNGSLDSSFNGTGLEVTDFGGFDLATAVALQADGKPVAVGYATISSNTNFALARYNIFKRPSTIYNSVAQENGRHGFNIEQAAKITLFNNVSSNNACNGFLGAPVAASAVDTITKNIGDNNNCADYSNIDSILLSPAAGAWKNIRLS